MDGLKNSKKNIIYKLKVIEIKKLKEVFSMIRLITTIRIQKKKEKLVSKKESADPSKGKKRKGLKERELEVSVKDKKRNKKLKVRLNSVQCLRVNTFANVLLVISLNYI